MVGKQLSHYRSGEAEGKARSVGYDDVPIGFYDGLGADGEHFSSARPNLRNAGFVLGKERVVRQEHYRRAILVDEGESAVLEFPKRHGVRVEVGDLFEFEGGFSGDGQHVPAS